MAKDDNTEKIIAAIQANFPNIRVMATIALPDNPNSIEWAIFFEIKKVGAVYYSERNLWFFPISEAANNEALKAQNDKSYSPKITCSEIILRNINNSTGKWESYKFWFEKKDPFLAITFPTHLRNLSRGQWKEVNLNGQKVSYWKTNEDIGAYERVLVFPAPESLIPENNEALKFPLFDTWFGFEFNSGVPYFAIRRKDESNHEADKDGYPILWGKNGLKLDLLEHTGTKVAVEYWEKREPFTYNGQSKTPQYIKDSFFFNDNINYEKEELKCWLIKEENKIHPVFTKSFYTFRKSGNNKLHEHLGHGKYSNFISIIQVCREKINILNRVSDFCFKESNPCFTELWGKTISPKELGLKETRASSPIGITPQFSIKGNSFVSYLSEWVTEYFNCSNSSTQSLFNLTKTLIREDKSGKLIDLICEPTNLLLVHPEGFNPLKKEDKKLVLTNAKLSSQKDNSNFVSDNGTLFQVFLTGYVLNETGQVIQDGSLSFKLSDTIKVNENDLPTNRLGRFRLTLQLEKAQRPFFLWQWYEGIDKIDNIVVSYAIEDFLLPVTEVKAAGQDRLPGDRFLAPQTLGTVVEGAGERTEPSLIIPLSNEYPTDSDSTPYFLNISESVNVGQDHRISMKLVEFNPSAGVDKSSSIRAVILDSNPQFVGLVNARFLQQPGFDDGAWVLAVREEEGGWRFLDDQSASEGFQLVLPSQAIGEAYVKSNIKDENGNPIEIKEGEPKENEPIDYRFGAPAILRLAPERLDKRYVTAPWNLRRIWGQPGEVSPGIPLLEAQFELLYGLTGNLKPEKAFLAELASKLGEVPVPPVNTVAWNPTKEQQETFRKEWIKYLTFYRAWKSRLAILEPSVNDNFNNAKFDENLSYRPRIEFKNNLLEGRLKMLFEFVEKGSLVSGQTLDRKKLKDLIEELSKLVSSNSSNDAILKKREEVLVGLVKLKDWNSWKYELDNIENYKRIGAHLRYPIANDSIVIPDEVQIKPSDYKDLTPEKKIPYIHDKNGLAGGFHYGFESKAIYNEFWRESLVKGSSSAVLENPAFTSLGGYGKQIARFASDKTVIKSISTLGRTHFYAVERIGRIGAFWNKAKHVIEYERTVVPTEQFKDHPPHLGRLLVRKVREYIEILEPTRKYPDFTTSQPDAPGAVMGCTFKSKIIPVLSSWGHDVVQGTLDDGTPNLIGWEVPLWKPGANPKVYIKPQIQLELTPPIDSDETAILVNLSEPENLWFYTDTRETVGDVIITADVHKWPPVKNVDYTDLPEPEQYDINPAAGDSPELLEAVMPDVLDVLPGFERFTFKVDRNEIPAAVASRYYPKSGITGRMRSVSMSRSISNQSVKWWEEGTGNLKTAKDALGKMINGSSSILIQASNGFLELENELRNRKVPKLTESEIKKFQESYKTKIKSAIGNDTLQKLKALKELGITEPKLSHFSTLWIHKSKLSQIPTKLLWRESLEAADGIVNRVLSFYDDEVKKLINEIEKIPTASELLSNRIEKAFDRVKNNIETVSTGIEFSIDGIHSSILITINKPLNQIEKSATQLFEELNRLTDDLNIENLNPKNLEEKKKEILAIVEKAKAGIKPIIDKLKIGELAPVGNVAGKVLETLNEIEFQLKKISDNLNATLNSIEKVKKEIHELSASHQSKILNDLNDVRKCSQLLVAGIKDKFKELNSALKELAVSIVYEIIKTKESLIKESNQSQGNFIFILKEKSADLRNSIKKLVSDKLNAVLYDETKPEDSPTIFSALKIIDSIFKELKNLFISSLLDFFGDGVPGYTKWIDSLDSFKNLLATIGKGNVNAILAESRALVNTVNQEFGRLAGEVAQKVKDFDGATNAGEGVVQAGKQTLNNFRSVWEEFTAPGMGLNRKTIALIVRTNPKDIQERLSITPCISRVKQFGYELEGLGLRMPVVSITDRLLPAIKRDGQEMLKSLMSNFDFSNLLSDIGGMRLDKLFPGFKMPDIARDNIKITQGFDKQNLMAWINAEANVGFADKKTLMSYGALQVSLESGSFKAKTRIEVNSEGSIKKNNKGELRGSWHIAISGTSLMIFRDTGVIFDNGKFTFDLDPSRMEMPGLLKLLTEATQTIQGDSSGGSDSGDEEGKVFKIGLLKQNGIPTGLKAALDIPPISVSGGVAGISNLSFGGFFMLSFLDEKFKPRFITGCGFYVGTRANPFNVTIFFLGGGGYIQYAMYFNPSEGITVRFAMSMHVSASFEVALGWIQGGLTIRLGLEGIYEKYPNRNSSVYISIFVEVYGHVEIIRLISVQLYIMLQATYVSSGNSSQLVGTGRVRLTIRVCSFVKIKVEKSYTKVLSQSGSNSNKLADDSDRPKRVEAILNSLN